MGYTTINSSKPFDYGVGALIVLVFSLGIAAIVYSTILSFSILNIPAWVFGPLGIYTLAYSFVSGKKSTYFSVWGTVMVAVALVFGFYEVISPFVILGALAILIALITLIAYQRSRK